MLKAKDACIRSKAIEDIKEGIKKTEIYKKIDSLIEQAIDEGVYEFEYRFPALKYNSVSLNNIINYLTEYGYDVTLNTYVDPRRSFFDELWKCIYVSWKNKDTEENDG